MAEFLTSKPIKLNEEELGDTERRKEMDEKRMEEQRRFYEIARQRAKELDVYMERFRRDIVERSTPCENTITRSIWLTAGRWFDQPFQRNPREANNQ